MEGIRPTHAVRLQVTGGHELHLRGLIDLHFDDLFALGFEGTEQELHAENLGEP